MGSGSPGHQNSKMRTGVQVGETKDMWAVGSHLEIFSKTANAWLPGQVYKIAEKDGVLQAILVIEYALPDGIRRRKALDRYSDNLRPEKTLEYGRFQCSVYFPSTYNARRADQYEE